MAARFQKSEVEWLDLTSVCKTFFFRLLLEARKRKSGCCFVAVCWLVFANGLLFSAFRKPLGNI